MKNKLPVVVGVEIPLDENGHYNLNTLHKASGLGDEKAPAKFLRNKAAKGLISELEMQTGQICTVSHEGRNGGTYAHELIAVEYAGWISPSFRLQVNQAFLDFKSGKSNIDLGNMPSLKHLTGRFEELRNMVARDEKQEAELLTVCSLIMNARKKTKGKRQLMIEALDKAGQVSMQLIGGGK